MKEFTICDYMGNKKKINLDLSKISAIMKYVISGDEILEVFYKDGDRQWIDSFDYNSGYNNGYRSHNFFDYSELVYSADMED